MAASEPVRAAGAGRQATALDPRTRLISSSQGAIPSPQNTVGSPISASASAGGVTRSSLARSPIGAEKGRRHLSAARLQEDANRKPAIGKRKRLDVKASHSQYGYAARGCQALAHADTDAQGAEAPRPQGYRHAFQVLHGDGVALQKLDNGRHQLRLCD